jgi:hypothetical protein
MINGLLMKKIHILLVSTLVAVASLMGMNDGGSTPQLTLSRIKAVNELAYAFKVVNGSEKFNDHYKCKKFYLGKKVTAKTTEEWNRLCKKCLKTPEITSKDKVPILTVNLQQKPEVTIHGTEHLSDFIFNDPSLRNILKYHQKIELFHDNTLLAILTIQASTDLSSSDSEDSSDVSYYPGEENDSVITTVKTTNKQLASDNFYTITSITRGGNGIYQLHLTKLDDSSTTTISLEQKHLDALDGSLEGFGCVTILSDMQTQKVDFKLDNFKKKYAKVPQQNDESTTHAPTGPTTSLRTKMYSLMAGISLGTIGVIIASYIAEKNEYYHNLPTTKFIDSLVNDLSALVSSMLQYRHGA